MSEKSRMPVKLGGRYFSRLRRAGLQNQGVLYWAPALDALAESPCRPEHAPRADATASLADYSCPVPMARYVAYSRIRRRHGLG